MTAKKPTQSHPAIFLNTRAGQGIVAFVAASASFFLIGLIMSGFPPLGGFIFDHLYYVPHDLHSWSGMVVFWNYASNVLSGVMMMTITAALVSAAVILVFRWLGLKPQWLVLKRFFIWAIVANIVVLLLSTLPLYFLNNNDATLWLQTLVALMLWVQLASMGLPYAVAWLIATRTTKK